MSANESAGRPGRGPRATSSGEPRARQLADALTPYLIAGEVVAVVIIGRCPDHPDDAEWRLGLAAPEQPEVDPFAVAVALAEASDALHADAIAGVASRN